MGRWSEKQEVKRKARRKIRPEEKSLLTIFFDLSKLVFAALVLGGITPLFTNISDGINWVTIVLEIFSTYMFANFANRILK